MPDYFTLLDAAALIILSGIIARGWRGVVFHTNRRGLFDPLAAVLLDLSALIQSKAENPKISQIISYYISGYSTQTETFRQKMESIKKYLFHFLCQMS